MQKDDVLLRMEGICKSFPGVKALDDAQLTVRPGTVHALMGENGAGKSTLMKCLFGIYSKDAGTIWFDGKEVNFKSSRDALDNGVAMVHQELNQALKRSVMDNIWLGRYPRIKLGGAKMPFVSDKAEYDMTMEVFKDLNFEKFGININPRTIMSTMPVSRRQMVEIAKAVSFNSKIIVLDEPTSSLTEAEVEVLFSIINMLKARGVGIVYISHKMKEIWRIADDVTVMRDGRWITTRHKTEYGTDDDSFRAEVIRNMCGRELSAAYPPKDNIVHDDPMIVVEGLTAKYNQLRDASFTLHKGEILGVAGLDGSGRTELLETLFGYRTRQSGTIKKFNFGFRAAQGGNVLVVYKDPSAVRALKQVDTAHQRGFSRAGEADYAEYLALFYLKAHIVRGVEFFAGVDVGLGNVLQTYHALLSPHCDVFRSPCCFGGRQHCMTVQFREALIKSRLTAWHAFCLHLFRYIAQFVLARRVSPGGGGGTQCQRG